MRLASALAVLALVAAAPPSPARAWSEQNHFVTGQVAAALLDANGRRFAQSLLGDARPETLGAAARWPDTNAVPPTYVNNRFWHYVNVPMKDGAYAEEACARHPYPHATRPDQCVIAIVGRLRAVLNSPPASDPMFARNADAVRFLLHFIGDIHQPLHCGDDGDRGGNDTMVQWSRRADGGFRYSTKLHAFWDGEAVYASGLAGPPLVNRLVTTARAHWAEWASGDAIAWCSESVAIALRQGYPDGKAGGTQTMSPAFIRAARDAAMQRMAQAGARMAWTLNTLGAAQ